MALTKAMLDELTAGYKTPQEMESLYSQMLQHMSLDTDRLNERLGNTRDTLIALAKFYDR